MEVNGVKVAEIIADGVVLSCAEDGMDIISECFSVDAQGIIMHEENLSPDFFELRTRLAGEVLQKFTQYHIRFAVVMDIARVESKSLRDFIRESNRGGNVIFASTAAEAMERLSHA